MIIFLKAVLGSIVALILWMIIAIVVPVSFGIVILCPAMLIIEFFVDAFVKSHPWPDIRRLARIIDYVSKS